jgi:taurine dioxygenase
MAVVEEAVRLELRKLSPALGAEILGVDLNADIPDRLFAAIWRAFLDYELLLFRGQDLDPHRHVAFARRFGPVDVHVMNQYQKDALPELYCLSNLDGNGRPNGKHPDKGTLAWHTDGSWRRVTGQATLLYAVEAPEIGGQTWWACQYAAYDALSEEEKRRYGAMRAVHNLDFSRSRRHPEDPMSAAQRAAAPPVEHPVIRTHPDTRRKCLYLGDHAERIVGLSFEESRRIIDALNEKAVDDAWVYRHQWRPGDLVVWDNRCLLHRATEYDPMTQKRVVRRATVNGEEPWQ